MKFLLHQPFLQRHRGINRPVRVLFIGLILGFMIWAPAHSINETPQTKWVLNPNPGPLLPFDPQNAQWFTFNNGFSAASLNKVSGEITIWKLSAGNWIEDQILNRPGIMFQTFQILDLNHDNIPEIIAGTSDPGYINIFQYYDGNWLMQNYEKYVWSSITNMAVGELADSGTFYILVQNREGYLFLFSRSGDALDLVWKSPSVWRYFESVITCDIDGDRHDEIVVSYRNGGVGILKVVNNSIVSVWENYLWGKVIVLTSGDWDNDGLPEAIFSTTQKIIYFLGYGGSGYQFEAQVSQFGFTTEQLAFLPLSGRMGLLAADTSGNLHVLDCDLKTKKWQENTSCSTGRIARIVVNPATHEINLWGYNQTVINLELINPKDLKLRFQNQDYSQDPAPIYLNSQWFISPRALMKINDLAINCQSAKTALKISSGTTQIEVSLKTPAIIKINGNPYAKTNQSYLSKNEVYFTADFYRQVLNLNIDVHPSERYFEIQKILP